MKKKTWSVTLLVFLAGVCLTTGQVMAATVIFFGQGGPASTIGSASNDAFQSWNTEAVTGRGLTKGEESFNDFTVGATFLDVSYDTNPGGQPVVTGGILGAEVVGNGSIFGTNGLSVVDPSFLGVDFLFDSPINAFGFFGQGALDSQSLEVGIEGDLISQASAIGLDSTGNSFFWGIVTDTPFDFAFLDSSNSIPFSGMEIDSVEIAATNPVPLPGSFLLFASGLLGLFWQRRDHRHPSTLK